MKRRRCLLPLSLGLALFICFTVLSVAFAGKWLDNSDKPQRADAIIVLAGDPSRAIYAADLYNAGYASAIYLSKPIRLKHERLLDELEVFSPRAEEINRRVLIKKGVPEKAVRIFGKSSVSTFEEANVLYNVFRGTKCSLLMVTSPYHVRRTKMIFSDVLKDCEVKVVATPYESIPEKWWKDQDSARNVLLEIVKILFYMAGGRFSSS